MKIRLGSVALVSVFAALDAVIRMIPFTLAIGLVISSEGGVL